MLVRAAVLTFLLVLASTAGASAHHSEAPHFIQNQMIDTGQLASGNLQFRTATAPLEK